LRDGWRNDFSNFSAAFFALHPKRKRHQTPLQVVTLISQSVFQQGYRPEPAVGIPWGIAAT
jgi:hypothetical protein